MLKGSILRSKLSDLTRIQLFQVFMIVRVTCNNEDDSIKALECSQHFSKCKSMGIFLTPDFMFVLVSWKNEEDSIKNEGAKVFTTLYIEGAANSLFCGGCELAAIQSNRKAMNRNRSNQKPNPTFKTKTGNK